ncbi:MAG: PAS domain S-box protein [Bacteroidetes bacterium]|nr:PAS domain S-box protein [Bacteroidota bacterium]
MLEQVHSPVSIGEMESAFRAFFENSKDTCLIIEGEGERAGYILLANPAAARLHGYTLEEFHELHIRDLLFSEDFDLIPARVRKIKTGETVFFESMHRHKDGSRIPIEVMASPLPLNGRNLIMSIGRDLTERKNAENFIQEGERFIERITVASPDIMYVFDLAEQRSIYANRHIADVLGYSPAEIRSMGDNFPPMLIHPEDLHIPPYQAERWQHTFDGQLIESEYRMKHKHGQWRWFTVRDTVFKRDDTGRVIQIVGTACDNTARIHAEQSRKQSLSVLNAALESTEDGILVVSREEKVTAYNKKFLSLWSITPSLMELQDDRKLLAHVIDQLTDPDEFIRRVDELYQDWGKEAHDVLQFKDGRVFERYSKPQYIGDEIAGRVWSFRDVTAREQKEASLRDSEERFKRLQEASFGGICIHDQGRIIDANQGLALMTGYSIEELVGLDGFQLVAPEFREHVAHKVRLRYELPYDAVGVKKDGTKFHVEIQGKNIPFQNREVRVTEFRDISNRKMIEESIREQNVRLTSIAENLTRKNSQLEEFTQIVSHNLRSPAGNIGSLVSLMEQSQGEEQKEYLKYLRESIQVLLNTLNHLNEVLRIKQDTTVERQQIRFDDVYQNIRQMLLTKIQELNADLLTDFSEVAELNYPVIYLESIMLNLIANALKYHSPRRKPIIKLSSFRKGKDVYLEVRDNGLGIDLVKYGHQMFKMRKTFHQHPEGQGLGLFLIKNQIEAMGGEISVESQVNKGATFFVNFTKYSRP